MYVTSCGTRAGDPTSRPLPRFELGGYDDQVTYAMTDEDGTLGIFGIALPTVISLGKKIFGGGGTGCVYGGPQQATRDLMQTIRTVNAYLFSKGLPIHEPSFAHLRSIADGSNQEAIDCPPLQAEVAAFLAEYEQNRVVASQVVTTRAPTFFEKLIPTAAGATGGLVPVAGVAGGGGINTLLLAAAGGLLIFSLLGRK